MSMLQLKRLLLFVILIINTLSAFSHTNDLKGIYSPKQMNHIDWDKAEKVTILFEDNNFEPDELTIKKGKPYIFKMVNVGDRSHDFVDLNLFHNIIVKRLQSDFGRINTHHIHSFYLKPGSSVSVYFVPHKSGEFDFFCSISGHREDGMEGIIYIEN